MKWSDMMCIIKRFNKVCAYIQPDLWHKSLTRAMGSNSLRGEAFSNHCFCHVTQHPNTLCERAHLAPSSTSMISQMRAVGCCDSNWSLLRWRRCYLYEFLFLYNGALYNNLFVRHCGCFLMSVVSTFGITASGLLIRNVTLHLYFP